MEVTGPEAKTSDSKIYTTVRVATRADISLRRPKAGAVTSSAAHLSESVTAIMTNATMNRARFLQAIAAPNNSISEDTTAPYNCRCLLSSPRDGSTKIKRTKSTKKTDMFASDCQVRIIR